MLDSPDAYESVCKSSITGLPLKTIRMCSIYLVSILMSVPPPMSRFSKCTFSLGSIPVAERSKERVYGGSLAGIAGSNPAGAVDVCVL